MKKGFISMTIIYSFLLIFIFTLLSLLILYTQKSRFVDSIVMELKENLYDVSNNSYTFVDSTQQHEFIVPLTGYYKVEIYNANGKYVSGNIYLIKNEKLYFDISNNSNNATSVKCYANNDGVCVAKNNQDENNSRIMYSNANELFISGFAGMNAPNNTTSSATPKDDPKHPTGKYFLNSKVKNNMGNTEKLKISYLGRTITKVTSKLNNIRYIKDCVTGNSKNTNHDWVEIQAIKNGTNIAKGKAVTSNGTLNVSKGAGRAEAIVDGGIDTTQYVQYTSSNDEICITVDLGTNNDLDEIAVWHYYSDNRVYYDNITSVSSDNTNWTEVMNETMEETFLGKRSNAYDSVINGYIQRGLLLWFDGIRNTGTTRDTNVTTWKDLSGNDKNGTLIGGPEWKNNSLQLDGSDDGVSLENNLTNLFKSSNSVQLVLERSENNARDILLGNYNASNSINYEVNTNNEYCIWFNSGAYNNSASASLYNQAYSVTFNLDRSNNLLKVFNNTFYKTEFSSSEFGSFNNSFNSAYLGRDSRTGTNSLKGKIYSFRVYNRLLSDDEIYHNYTVDKERFGID